VQHALHACHLPGCTQQLKHQSGCLQFACRRCPHSVTHLTPPFLSPTHPPLLACLQGEANALRQQLQDARTIRDGSKPDYETKMGRIKELQEMRKSYLDRISDIRSGQKGLEVRSEEDLDAKIASLEEEIASGSVELRVEKQLVSQIAKLRSQRDKVREFQAAQGDLGQLEADLKRVKAMLAEQQDEFKIITGERDQVKVIITDLQAKLKTVTDAISYLDSERSEIEAHKAELQEQLRAAREDNDAAMAEYRENRKLSLALRDLVDAGQVAAAAAQAAEQVEAYMAKLASDTAYRKEYIGLWCQQRKYLVSELLPKSGVVAAPVAPAPSKAGGKGGAKAPGPAVPQGAAMAQAAIAAALEAADAELAAQRRAAPAPVAAAPSSEEEEDVEPEAPSAAAPAADKQQRRIVPGAPEELLFVPKARQHKPADPLAAAAAHVAPAVEYEYVPPVFDKDSKQEVLSAAEQKVRLAGSGAAMHLLCCGRQQRCMAYNRACSVCAHSTMAAGHCSYPGSQPSGSAHLHTYSTNTCVWLQHKAVMQQPTCLTRSHQPPPPPPPPNTHTHTHTSRTPTRSASGRSRSARQPRRRSASASGWTQPPRSATRQRRPHADRRRRQQHARHAHTQTPPLQPPRQQRRPPRQHVMRRPLARTARARATSAPSSRPPPARHGAPQQRPAARPAPAGGHPA
jgi:uncharacterized coiled-coil DUF342 family protein